MDTTRTTRMAAMAMVIGAIVQAGCGIAQILGPLTAGQHGFGLRNTLVAIASLLLLAGLVGLWRTGVASGGKLGQVGLAAAISATGVLIVAELVEPFIGAGAEPIYSIASPLLGLGMVLAGIAALRARRWTSWRRFTPLACGLYILLVLLPVFAVSGPNYAVLTVFDLCWLALGAALWSSTASVAASLGSPSVGAR